VILELFAGCGGASLGIGRALPDMPAENEAWACVDAFTRVLVDRVARRAES
jgi:hypothetical protein